MIAFCAPPGFSHASMGVPPPTLLILYHLANFINPRGQRKALTNNLNKYGNCMQLSSFQKRLRQEFCKGESQERSWSSYENVARRGLGHLSFCFNLDVFFFPVCSYFARCARCSSHLLPRRESLGSSARGPRVRARIQFHQTSESHKSSVAKVKASQQDSFGFRWGSQNSVFSHALVAKCKPRKDQVVKRNDREDRASQVQGFCKASRLRVLIFQ